MCAHAPVRIYQVARNDSSSYTQVADASQITSEEGSSAQLTRTMFCRTVAGVAHAAARPIDGVVCFTKMSFSTHRRSQQLVAVFACSFGAEVVRIDSSTWQALPSAGAVWLFLSLSCRLICVDCEVCTRCGLQCLRRGHLCLRDQNCHGTTVSCLPVCHHACR
jgi:hypothetical protein